MKREPSALTFHVSRITPHFPRWIDPKQRTFLTGDVIAYQILPEMCSQQAEQVVTIDMDLSALPASKRAEHSKKGYVANQKNQYSRQLARVLVPTPKPTIPQDKPAG